MQTKDLGEDFSGLGASAAYSGTALSPSGSSREGVSPASPLQSTDAGFTPGPWFIGAGDDGSWPSAYVNEFGVKTFPVHAPPGTINLAEVYGIEADARLIAAAPDLYAALQEMVMAAGGVGLDAKTRRTAAMRTALAALASARGEQP